MKELFDKVGLSVNHLQALNDFFSNESIYLNEESETHLFLPLSKLIYLNNYIIRKIDK